MPIEECAERKSAEIRVDTVSDDPKGVSADIPSAHSRNSNPAHLKQTEIGQIPSSWEVIAFGNCFENLDSLRRPIKKSDRANMKGHIPYFGATGVIDYVNSYLFDEEILLISEDGANLLSRNYPITFLSSGMSFVNNHAHVVRANGTLELYLGAEYIDSINISDFVSGGAQPKLNKANLNKIPMPVPPLPEQEKITAILRSVNKAIASTEAVIEQTKCVKQGLLADLLTKGIGHTRFKQTEIGEIPESWKVGTLGQFAEFINGRGFKPHEWSTQGYPIIRIQNLNGGKDFNYHEGDFNPKILVESNQLLFAWSGSRGTSFGPHIWTGPTGVLNYHTWKVNPSEAIDKEFLYWALQLLVREVESNAHGASALVHVQKRHIVDYKFAVPPIEEQRKIVDVLSSTTNLHDCEQKRLLALRTTKNGLMADLLTGRKRVTV